MTYETLNECQKRAVNQLCTFLAKPEEKHMVLTGSGGTGKGYLLRYLSKHWGYIENKVSIFNNTVKVPKPEFTATTNEAVYQLQIPRASTIYRFATIRPSGSSLIAYRAPMMHTGLVFIDEASYIDEKTFKLIERQLPNYKIVWVMDQYQLAPVGSELPYAHTQAFRTVELRTIERCQGILQKLVQELREAVKNQEGINLRAYHCDDIQVVDTPTFHQMVIDRFKIDPDNSKVLMFKNASVEAYNKAINERALGHPPFPYVGATAVVNAYNNEHGLKVGTRFHIYDIQYFDTEMVLATSIGHVLVPNDKKDMCNSIYYMDIALPYASTTHKAQGSTIDTMFVDAKDIFSTWDAEMRRRLIYVAISRASKKVVICL